MTDVLRVEYSLLTAVPTAFSPAGETAERSDGAPVQLLCSTELLADAAGSRFVSFPTLPHLFQVSCALHLRRTTSGHWQQTLSTRQDGWGEFRRRLQPASRSTRAVLLASVAKLPRGALAIRNLNGGES